MYIIYSVSKYTRPFPIIHFHRNIKLNQTDAMPPFCYFPFYNHIYSINFYIPPRSSSTQYIYCEQYGSQLKSSHDILFVITECLELKFKAS